MNEFDKRAFIDNLRATKPPYECPFQNCGRVYKSFSGIQTHLLNVEHPAIEKRAGSAQSGLLTPPPKENNAILLNGQSQKFLEYENFDGKLLKINILEPLEVLNLNPIDSISDNKTALKEIIQNIREKSASVSPKPTLKIPDPSFRILEEFDSSDAPPLPDNYIKYIEKPPEDLEDEVEYDMDEEDHVWLTLINDTRSKSGLSRVTEATLEKVIDYFEKQSHFAATHQQPPLFDEDAVCCVCQDGECDNANAILFCDMCNLSVHQECYGVPYIPEGQWLCRRCQLSPSQAVDCVLCPNRGGAYKQTSDGRWAHVVCALWVPEVQFANTVFLEPIEGFERIPPARWKLSCYVCKQKKTAGACIQCHKPSCYTAFHVTCAQMAGLYMKIEPIKDLSPGGNNYTVRKTAYCDLHAPSNENLDVESPEDSKMKIEKREESRAKIRKARKLLSQRRNSSPAVSVPVVSKSKIEEISTELKLAGKQQFLDRLLKYWILKRQSRFGVPLLRRLQVYQPKKPVLGQDGKTDHLSQTSYWKQIRRDLEKARLLVELIRKREQRKKELIINSDNLLQTYLKPIFDCMTETVERMLIKDEMTVFTKPVNEEEVPGYHRFIQHPMDLGTMLGKAKQGQYLDPNDLQKDFDLMISNCLKFNKKNPFFLKYAQKMKKLCLPDLKECHDDFENILNETASSFVPLSLTTTDPENNALTSSSNSDLPSTSEKLTSPFSLFSSDKKESDSKLLESEKVKNPKPSSGATDGVSGSGSGMTTIKKKRPPSGSSRGSTKTSGQSDIRKFFGQNTTSNEPGSKNESQKGKDEDESGPLVHLAKSRNRKSNSENRKSAPNSQQNPPKSGSKSYASSSRKKLALKTSAGDKTSGRLSADDSVSSEFSPELATSSSKFVATTTTTPTTGVSTTTTHSSQGSPPLLSVSSPKNQTSSTSVRNSKEHESFKKFRNVSPLSPGLGSDVDLENFGAKYANSESDDDSATERQDCSKRKTSIKDKNSKSKSSAMDQARQKTDLRPPENRTLSIVDLLEHLDIVWALTNDYAYYFPAVIIDSNNTTDYPSCIPKPPKDINKKLDLNVSASSRYLILLFDEKSTWRWVEKHLVEPMFIDNDVDRRKLASPCKRPHKKIVFKAYKTAVDFRCKNTGEVPEEFSLISDTAMYDDSDDSSS